MGVEAMIAHGGRGLAKCRLRDISLEGAFIETAVLRLSKNADVDLVLKIRSGRRTKHCRVPARVARVTEDGAALVFGKLEEQVYRTLIDIVYV